MGDGWERQGGSPGCAADGERKRSRWKCTWRRRAAAAAEKASAMEVGLRGPPAPYLAATATAPQAQGAR